MKFMFTPELPKGRWYSETSGRAEMIELMKSFVNPLGNNRQYPKYILQRN